MAVSGSLRPLDPRRDSLFVIHRKQTMKTPLIAALSFFFALISATSVRAQAPEVGKPAPGFSLTDTHGETCNLAAYQGRTVVLEWVNYGCPFVKKHYGSGNMQKLQKAAAADGVVWLSICSSAPGKEGFMSADDWNRTETAKGAAPAAVLLDPDGKVGHLYHATNTPQMFIIDAKGLLVYAGAIDSIASTKPEDIPVATNYISAALADLKAGRSVAMSVSKPYGCGVKY